MVDFILTEEQLAIRDLCREFVEQEIKPTIKERERIEDPAQRFPWDIVEKASKLGIRTLAAPKKYGGGGADTLTICIAGEEISAGDLGIGVIFDQTWKFTHMLFNFCNADQHERYLKPFMEDDRALLALGATEPESGSDSMLPYSDDGAGIRTFAERRDGGYVLNGMKHFISTGSDSRLYTIMARTHRTKTYQEGGLSAFVIERGTPGFRIGRIHDKIGQRLINNSELIMENCFVPEADRLLGEGEFYPAFVKIMRGSNTEAAATTLGVGRAAYEAAVAWAQQRVQGGKPIIEHQAIGTMLADMAIKLETARLIIWKAAWATDYQEPFDRRLPMMAKAYASEAAFDVARLAMEIHGGYGIMKDLPLEKYLRDTATFLHSDGTNQIQKIKVARLINQGLI